MANITEMFRKDLEPFKNNFSYSRGYYILDINLESRPVLALCFNNEFFYCMFHTTPQAENMINKNDIRFLIEIDLM